MEQEIILNGYIEGLFLKEDLQYMEEGLADVVAKFTQPVMKKIFPKMFNIAASKNLGDFEKLLSKEGIKRRKVTEKDIKDFITRMPEEVQTGAEYAGKVIQNSIPKGSKNMKLLASYYVTILAKIKHPKNQIIASVKTELKSFIPKVRSFYEEAEDKASQSDKKISVDDITDMAIAIGAVVGVATLVGLIAYGIITLGSTLLTVLTVMLWMLPAALIVWIVMTFYRF